MDVCKYVNVCGECSFVDMDAGLTTDRVQLR